MKVKARISKTNRFREVTLRRDPDFQKSNDMLYVAPAYLHQDGRTISGVAKETTYDKWTFIPTGKYSKLLYS